MRNATFLFSELSVEDFLFLLQSERIGEIEFLFVIHMY